MRIRGCAVLLVLLAALLVAACGGGGGGGKSSPKGGGGGSVPAGADYVPSSAAGFISGDSDSSSSQWKTATALLNKFPGKAQLLASIEQSLAKQKVDYARDVKPALGPEIDLGLLSIGSGSKKATGLALTQPKDESRFEALSKKIGSSGSPALIKRIGGWTAASKDQSVLDAAASAHSGSSLADNATFQEAMKDLPSAALVKLWFDGAAITGAVNKRARGTASSLPGFGKLVSVAAAFEAKSGGVSLKAVVKSDKSNSLVKTYSSKLVSEVPAGVLAYVSFSGLDGAINAIAGVPAVKAQLGQIETQLGVSLAELAPLFSGEGALYVRQGIPLPEITLALDESDTTKAQATADKLFTRLAPALGGQLTSTTVSGVAVKQLKGPSFSIYYGTFDGKLVVSDSTTGISGLKDTGAKLADDSLFKEAKDAAGMPDTTAGFVYLNLKDAVPLIENLLSSTSTTIPPAVQQNLAPLHSLLLYATVAGSKTSVSGFVGIQ